MREQILLAAYVDEMHKLSGIGAFIGRGLKQLGAIGGLAKKKGLSGLGGALKSYYQQHGVGGLARKFAPGAAVLGGGGLAAYGAGKATFGD